MLSSSCFNLIVSAELSIAIVATHRSVWAPKCGVPGTLGCLSSAIRSATVGTPGAWGLEAPDATGEVALEGAADVRKLSNLATASASTPGSTGSCSASPLLSPSARFDWVASPAGLGVDTLESDAFLECESEERDGKARSDISEFGAVARSLGDRFLGTPCDGGGRDMMSVRVYEVVV